MAVSQNGWPAGSLVDLVSVKVPGGSLRVASGPVSVVLQWVAVRFNATVEPLRWPGCWGFADRDIRGSSTAVSNHASGTAIDLNAPKHPLGSTGTFTTRQVAAIRAILSDLDGVVRWGGDYSGRKDEMHFEINASWSRVAAMAGRIQRGELDDMTPDQVEAAVAKVLGGWQIKTDDPTVPAGKDGVRWVNAGTFLAQKVARRTDVGYARDQLLAAVKAGMQAGPSADADAIVDEIANRLGGQS